MPRQGNQPKPWWREPWPWILMAGPFVTLVGCAFTIVLAVQSFADEPIIVDGERRGLVVSKKSEQVPAAVSGHQQSHSHRSDS